MSAIRFAFVSDRGVVVASDNDLLVNVLVAFSD